MRKNFFAFPYSILTRSVAVMEYFDASWQECDWLRETVKELISNANDFLREAYPNGTKETRKIAVRVKIDSISDGTQKRIIMRITVRNSNVKNIAVFDNLEQIFDYTRFYSTKRHQHKISSGALGDFLKRSLGMGYALWTSSYQREYSLVANSKQWPEPVILRHNGKEDKIFFHVDWDNQAYWPIFSDPIDYDAYDFTEVEVALPIDSTSNDHWRNNVERVINQMQAYVRRTEIAKVNTDLTFSVEKSDL